MWSIRVFILLVLTLAAAAAQAGWTVSTHVDAMTDERRKSARVTNDLGHSFSVYRITSGGAAWGNFALSDDVFDQVDWDRLPRYRIDKNEPHDLSRLKRMQQTLGMEMYSWEPKWINFRLWHGKYQEGLAADLVEMMTGDTLLVRYHLSTGGYKDTTFTLEGAGPAIAEALDIPQEIDLHAQEKNSQVKELHIERAKQCLSGPKAQRRSCMDKATACAKSFSNDPSGYRACQ